jgi:hypothetical protein
MTAFTKASSHWEREIRVALTSGKTVFVVLTAYKEDQGATGSTSANRNSRHYHTSPINNYSIIPGGLKVRNARGRAILVKNPAFRGLYDSIEQIFEYHIILEASANLKTTFAAKDGTAVGGVFTVGDLPGSLVLVPQFDFEADGVTEYSEENDDEVWTKQALKTSHALVGQMVAIDQMLRGSIAQTPPPDWMNGLKRPKAVEYIEKAIAEIDAGIEELSRRREDEVLRRADVLEYSNLLYESGKPLERAIEKVLLLLGYAVNPLRLGDLEIDHVIVSPSGIRMIGESEGKDTSAIDISKFRQLESNIGEDFERADVNEPAKGLLFGNGFRLSAPESRAEQFTQKSLTNARRLGSALIRTADLYAVALHLLDHPEDDAFRSACRTAIELTAGGIVAFPIPESSQ